MNTSNEIIRWLQFLQNEDIRVTDDFVKDIQELIKTNFDAFAAQSLKDFARKNFDGYNRFKKLSLNKKQKGKIGNDVLWRYEYRNTSNLRCIFILKKVHTNNIPILLCAFNENGGKKNGKDSYNHNIERAINIYNNLEEEDRYE